MITKRSGNGQTICKGCKDKGNFGLTWDSWLYNFNNEPYCFECLIETLENYQDRIDKAIEYIEKYTHEIEGITGYYYTISDTEYLLEILKGK